jgi:hypothetical protein
MRLISAGSLVRAQSGPLDAGKSESHTAHSPDSLKKNSSKINNEFRLRLDGHKPRTEDKPAKGK